MSMQAILRKAGQEASTGGNLEALLGIFSKLLASKRHNQDSFAILEGIAGNLPLASFQQFLPKVSRPHLKVSLQASANLT